MDMNGERRIPAPRQRVWDALNDPEMLKAAIPGCESVTKTADDAFEAKVAVKIGPMAAKFGGKVKLENIQAPLLVIYSPQDKVVSPTATEQAFARFGSPHKQLLALADTQDDSHHVLAGKILSPRDTPRVEAAILAFLQPLLSAQP